MSVPILIILVAVVALGPIFKKRGNDMPKKTKQQEQDDELITVILPIINNG